MRALLLHANKFKVKVVEKSSRPRGIIPEQMNNSSEEMRHCLVVFFCVEKGDSDTQLDSLYKEIIKSAKELSTNNLVIAPFVHLSKNTASPENAKGLYQSLVQKFDGSNFVVQTSHFGYHKSLLLDIKGHPGSFRYREFN